MIEDYDYFDSLNDKTCRNQSIFNWSKLPLNFKD